MAVDNIEIVEVGARDGLQNEDVNLATVDKVELINKIVAAGVSAGRDCILCPSHTGAADGGRRSCGGWVGDRRWMRRRIGLVLNWLGLQRALTVDVDEINFVVGATEGFNQANQRSTVADTMASIEEMVPVALEAARRQRSRSLLPLAVRTKARSRSLPLWTWPREARQRERERSRWETRLEWRARMT